MLLIVIPRSCSSFRVSVRRMSPAFSVAIMPAAATRESVSVLLPAGRPGVSVPAPTPRVARPRPARRHQGQARPRAAGHGSRAGVKGARTVIHVRDDGQVPDVELVVHLLTQPGARRHGCSSASAVQRRRQASKRREHALFDSELLGRRRRQGRDRSRRSVSTGPSCGAHTACDSTRGDSQHWPRLCVSGAPGGDAGRRCGGRAHTFTIFAAEVQVGQPPVCLLGARG